jgi:nitrate reductase gamma subunit
MAGAPVGFQIHIIAAFALFAFWPFTRLVHAFSAPVGYLTRPYIPYRSRDPRPGLRRQRPGWEGPPTLPETERSRGRR